MNYMRLALEEAQKAALKKEFPVGAVLVAPNGDIIVKTHNLNRTLCDPTAHAEILALKEGGKIMGSMRLEGCSLYVSLEPCTMCAGAISHARIKNLYYALEDPKGGAVSNGVCFFSHKNCLHKPDIYYPFEEFSAQKIIHDFVQGLRK